MARRRRDLSPEERRLWEHVARQAQPLDRRGAKPRPALAAAIPAAEPPAPPIPATATTPMGREPREPFLPAYRPPVSAPRAGAPAAPAVGTLERGERRALRRRVRDVEAVIDLHGMRQEEAHPALAHFLRSSCAAGRSIVLVVTGKGGAQGGAKGESGPMMGLGDERGILRRLTPHWLRSPEMRPFVLGFEEASLHHGGSGALYVRLRRRGR